MTAQCKNYTKPGGAETVIGGKLTFAEGAQVDGLPLTAATCITLGGVKMAEAQADSTASTIAVTVVDFNALLAKLRAAGLLASE
jgi:hypothetical protein